MDSDKCLPVHASECAEERTEFGREGAREVVPEGPAVTDRRPSLAARTSSLHTCQGVGHAEPVSLHCEGEAPAQADGWAEAYSKSFLVQLPCSVVWCRYARHAAASRATKIHRCCRSRTYAVGSKRGKLGADWGRFRSGCAAAQSRARAVNDTYYVFHLA